MLKKIILTLSLCLCSLISMADQLKINDDAPKTHIVVKGDTLWDISAIFLEQPWLWPKLWRLNPEINNPHLIYPGDIITLVFDEKGEPMLVLEPVKASYKWSPKIRQKSKGDTAISLLPLEVIAPFIKYDHLFSADELKKLPYVLGNDEGYKSSVNGFKVYVNKELDLAKTYAIYNKGEEVIDPETTESLGFYVDLVATGQALRTGNESENEPATLKISTAKREIRSGDFVVPVHEGQMFPSVFTMKAADKSLRGSIIKASSNAKKFGKLEVVMINRGTDHQVTVGDVMAIKRLSPGVVDTDTGPEYTVDTSRWNRLRTSNGSDYKMPEEPLGELMVFKVYQQASMALILRTEKPARLQDVVTAPE
ncbi:LysM peptidoglycan-binding domain-containing protein [Candidatus Colwellia aromaticivorans]|uniref:LysM peptidoglycan-binding domain-containing protein n=1 Tax=Candidatus Colwellia aromaticivorans TaxID=2267621 RepID=UPI000DF2D988|nr:LysM domain-containing protein [Candidatus Colwellia aromaticivorans]